MTASLPEPAGLFIPKLPTEIVGYISEFCDFQTHTVVRSLCSAVRSYVPRPKVVGFEDLQKLVNLLELDGEFKSYDEERRRIVQERIHLDIVPKMLRTDHLKYLRKIEFQYELCRIARIALDNPKDFKDIDLLFGDCYLIGSAAFVGDVDLLKRLLLVPNMDPTGNDNEALKCAAEDGHLAIIQFLLRDPRVDPSAIDNFAIKLASCNGHVAVVQTLLEDSRVDPSANDNYAIRFASQNGHLAVVQALLQDSRVDPTAIDNNAIRIASKYGHIEVMKCLLDDMRVDPSARHNYAIRNASQNGHSAAVALLLLDPRVDGSVIGL